MSERKDEQASIRFILENPADFVARLVFADWLDEHPTPARQARAALIRLQVERDRGGRSVPCRDCDGYGSHLGAGPDRGNPVCTTCKGERVIVPTGPARMAAVSNSIRKEEAILKQWGSRWIPGPFRKVASVREIRFRTRSDTVEVGGDDGLIDSFTFGGGFIEWVTLQFLNLNDNLFPLNGIGSWDGIGSWVRSLVSANPIRTVRIELMDLEPAVKLEIERTSNGLAPYQWRVGLTLPDGPRPGELFAVSDPLYYLTRRDMLNGLPVYLGEWLPRVPMLPRPGYYSEPDPPHEVEPWNQDLPPMTDEERERDAEARNRVDAPHER